MKLLAGSGSVVFVLLLPIIFLSDLDKVCLSALSLGISLLVSFRNDKGINQPWFYCMLSVQESTGNGVGRSR